ncbi:hypothetical protein [Pseudoduganella violaceinigra]|uniref:hypothetical protein n=1 Tax=Pseudoduganella violaceinigra TaxID=246602 RepID=UPI000427A0DA|nr:hypothetical protein [Pseudoduganella violaceinigra]
MQTDFSWNDEVGVVVVKDVAATAVYTNDANQVVIRQKGTQDGGDVMVVLPALYVPFLIDALQQELDDFNVIDEETTS